MRQGDEGDYYYLIEQGTAEVSRVDEVGTYILLAKLQTGSAFGEEALASGNRRNATVRMLTEGVLLRLGKLDFIELLKKPLLHEINKEEAKRKVQAGAKLLDVRKTAEYGLKHLPGALNVPLDEIRSTMASLDKTSEYLVYCHTGRRSAAATFIMAQHGFTAIVLSLT